MPKFFKQLSCLLVALLQAFQIFIETIGIFLLCFFLTVLLECLTRNASMKFLNFKSFEPLQLRHLHTPPTEMNSLSFLQADHMRCSSPSMVDTGRPSCGPLVVNRMRYWTLIACLRRPGKRCEEGMRAK